MAFHHRREAGRILATYLARYANRPDVVVLALPRGGVPVGFEVAEALAAPLDIFLVRKLGVPGQEELAMGAIASGGVRLPNAGVLRHLKIPAEVLDAIAAREWRELERGERVYRDGRSPATVDGRTVILVDDGLATGTTMRAAIAGLRAQRPSRIVVAVPTGAPETCDELRREVDELICVATPTQFYAVGIWYEDFSPITDDTVRALLAEAARRHPTPDATTMPPSSVGPDLAPGAE